MKYLVACLCLFGLSWHNQAYALMNCKTIKDCSDLVTKLTGKAYDAGKYEKRSLRPDPELEINSSNADALFTLLLEQNKFSRVQMSHNSFKIVDLRDLQSFEFPLVKIEEIPATGDSFTVEYEIKTDKMAATLLSIGKKYLSKSGSIKMQVGESKIRMVETGHNLRHIIDIFKELDK